MSVSKRLRYEVLRRDNHACRYCGAAAPDAKLTVDHVLPVALGGTDEPGNLVAACFDCNSGKAASNPDSPLLDQVSDAAIKWAKAVETAAIGASIEFSDLQETRGEFDTIWSDWSYGYNQKPIPRPADWCDTVDMLKRRGMPLDLLEECVRIAMTRSSVAPSETFRYFCGVAWRKLAEIESVAKSIYDSWEAEKSGVADGS